MAEFHERFDRDEGLELSSDRSFGLLFAAIFLLIACVQLWLAHESWPYFLAASVIFAVISFLRPSILHPLNKLWMKFGLLLFSVISPIAMLLLYVTTIVPIGVMMRITGKDPMRRKRDVKASSYWITREAQAGDSMKQQF